ncbi:UDP-N-acetylmuramate dehydrogenase [Chloroflexota bacterium]
MLSEQLKDILSGLVSGGILFDESMRNHTSLAIGGNVDALFVPRNVGDLRNVMLLTTENRVSATVIGNGTNLLVSDEGIDGIIIKIADCFNTVSFKGRKIRSGAGCSLSVLSKLALDKSLSGLEFTTGIPGTVGGAVANNAGTHGEAMDSIVTKVEVLNLRGETAELTRSELDFGYRRSVFQEINMAITSVELELREGVKSDIEQRIRRNRQQRHGKFPLNLRSAGSIFKNPSGGYAGNLIESCGCKGMSVGGAEVSELHANFIVNKGSASALDVLNLMQMIKDEVFKEYGIKLEPEISIIGKGIDVYR